MSPRNPSTIRYQEVSDFLTLSRSKGVTTVIINGVVVFLGGALGATSRFLLSAWLNQTVRARWPVGTFAVNVVGSFLIGVVASQSTSLGGRWTLFLDMGFIGAFTTFSSFSYETLTLIQEGQYLDACLNPLLSIVVGLLGVAAGILTGRAL